MRGQTGKRYSEQVYEQACEWFVEFRAGAADEEVGQAFHSWLQQAPAHIAAYLDVAASWNRTGSLDVSAQFPKEMLIAQAKEADNLLVYPGGSAPRKPLPQRRGWGSRLLSPRTLALAAGALALIAAVLVSAWMRASPAYSTGIGQSRLIRLADGSIVDLNADSHIIVRYTRTRREIDLVRGQALFVDTYQPDRPFIVRSRATVVRAMGTQFDVNLLHAETIVTVIEGKVAVARQRALRAALDRPRPVLHRVASSLSTVYLTAGEQLTVTPLRRMRPVRANVTDAIAWMHHKLIFASTALRDVVQEFNRYNARQLVIASPSLETFKIDGVFSSTNPRSLIAFLRQYPGIEVTSTGESVVISRR